VTRPLICSFLIKQKPKQKLVLNNQPGPMDYAYYTWMAFSDFDGFVVFSGIISRQNYK